jgi:hypothetical protein
MSKPFDCLLTLAVPAVLEEELLDHINALPQWVSGHTVVHAEGAGRTAALRSTTEQVTGRAQRRLLMLLMHREHLHPLLNDLAAQFQTPEIAWWVSAVEESGRFG